MIMPIDRRTSTSTADAPMTGPDLGDSLLTAENSLMAKLNSLLGLK